MRVTSKILSENVTRNIFKNTEVLYKLQNEISSAKRINKPSDDPIGIGRVLDYRKILESIGQFQTNISNAEALLNLTDSTLDSVDTLLIRAKELAISQSTESATENTREITSGEIAEIYDQIMNLANTRNNKSYIFAGYNTLTIPFERDENYNIIYSGGNVQEVTQITTVAPGSISDGDHFFLSSVTEDYYVWYDTDGDGLGDPEIANRRGIRIDISTDVTANDVAISTAAEVNALSDFSVPIPTADIITITNNTPGRANASVDQSTGFSFNTFVEGDSGDISIMIGESSEIIVNSKGDETFLEGENIFNVLRDLMVELDSNNTHGIQQQIERLDNCLNNVVINRAKVGSRLNRLETTANHWENFHIEITNLLSDVEDTDLPKAITELTSKEAVFEASLSTAANIIQPTLIEFLR
jgi:flagellar hook-associated protein 3 FlgL